MVRCAPLRRQDSGGRRVAPRGDSWLGDSPRPHAVPWASPVFCRNVLQGSIIQRQIRHHLFELAVLVFELAQPPELTDFQAAILGLPAVVGAIADSEFAADIGDGLSCLHPLQDPDDLLFAEPALAHD